ADVGVGRRIDARVQRVRLAAVFLVEDTQVRVGSRGEGDVDGGRRDPGAQSLADRNEIERLTQPLERPVGRAVADHDHLVVRIPQVEQRVDRGYDSGLF